MLFNSIDRLVGSVNSLWLVQSNRRVSRDFLSVYFSSVCDDRVPARMVRELKNNVSGGPDMEVFSVKRRPPGGEYRKERGGVVCCVSEFRIRIAYCTVTYRQGHNGTRFICDDKEEVTNSGS